MPEIQIANFKGINTTEGNWKQGYAKYAVGVDIFGLQDNTSKISYPGVIQAMKGMTVGLEAAATNDVTDLIYNFALYSSEVWGLSDGARLYKRVSGDSKWTLQRSTSGGDLTATTGTGGLAAFNGDLWVFQNSRISRWQGSPTNTWTQQFGGVNFLSTSDDPRPSKVMIAKLFIGDGRYVASIDSTPTLVQAALTLPSDFKIKSMEVFGDRLYIMADNAQFSRLFIWDGVSSTFNSFFDLFDEAIAPSIIFNDGVLWAVATRGANQGTPIYTFDGSKFTKQFILPIQRRGSGRNALTTYRGGILIPSDSDGTLYEDGSGGVWYLNRYDANGPYQAVIAFMPSSGVINIRIGGLYANANANNIYVATDDVTSSHNFEVWELNATDTNTPSRTNLWQSLPIDADDYSRQKTWHGIFINSELSTDTSSPSRTVVVKYRTNYQTSFTTLKTQTATNSPTAYIPIGVTSRVIEIRLEPGSATSVITTRIHGFTLFYSLSQQ